MWRKHTGVFVKPEMGKQKTKRNYTGRQKAKNETFNEQ